MLKTIYLKTLYEKRWSTLAWSIAIVLMTVMTVSLFPTFKESFGESLKDVPESLKAFLGEASDYQTISGFVDLQVFAQMVWLTVIHGVILFSGLIAGEENDGTLQSLLSQPVSRSRVYLEKLMAGMTIVGIVTASMLAAIVASAAMVGESLNLSRLLQAGFAFWLVTLFLSLLAYALGAITGRRGIAGAIVGLYGFASLLITSLSETVTGLKTVNYLSPFKYFNTPSVLESGLDARNVSVLIGGCLMFGLIAWVIFRKRDIFAR